MTTHTPLTSCGSLLLAALALSSCLVGLSACKASECQQMLACCDAIADLPGVGPRACGSIAEGTKDPQTCRVVKQTARYMLEDRKNPIPAACQ